MVHLRSMNEFEQAEELCWGRMKELAMKALDLPGLKNIRLIMERVRYGVQM